MAHSLNTQTSNKIASGSNINQVELCQSIIDKTGLNIVTCGHCGEVNIIKSADEEHQCFHCGTIGESCDFPDLFY